MIHDFIQLIYPRLCCLCGEDLMDQSSLWCLKCDLKLPKTRFGSLTPNPLYQSISGLWPVQIATSSYYFKKGNNIQSLLHLLKYKGEKEVGTRLGLRMAEQIKSTYPSFTCDAVLPVPLHPSKLLIRGYNQAAVLATEIAQVLACECVQDCLERSVATSTQTKKSRFNRWGAVESVFSITNQQQLESKHVLLVDDVYTTGATISGCMSVLSEIKGIKISVITLAVADY